nr:hypothetical protein [Allomuricauda sp.]
MKNTQKRPSVPIQTLKVYSKDEIVFTKDDKENWLPVRFNWAPVQTA